MARKPDGELRRGWTTGACATAATKAAYSALLTGNFPDPVTIHLPKGQEPAFALAIHSLEADSATAGVIKDAGDDPDVTHGCLVRVTVTRGAPGSGVVFVAGEGVGTVTRSGLQIPPGEAAVNPVPRQLMTDHVAEVAQAHGDAGDVRLEIAIPGGTEIAKETLNGRLGILGGLSVLGTTGVVIPYSCASWIHSIHRGIDVAREAGMTHVAGATGSTSEAAVKALYGLDEIALLDMGDFAGGLLKYLREHPVAKLSIAGGFGKLAKLAQGHLDLHSGKSRVDTGFLAEVLGEMGAGAEVVAQARGCETGAQVLAVARAYDLPLADLIAARAAAVAQETAGDRVKVEVLIFDREGTQLGSSEAVSLGA
ncbi:cobalt-precorrin-5B (C(1))-methyltransferase [Rhodovibrio salinarum]|uniref:Cobalt-precorrin-5B C(1)-methyltransferase n=1 Tax=Rhodovibrio salinarum TaxID=1087 RepID=A0A934QJ96_9PROT|nr:cobalt-precorrin-5B (C(1))-methyltransferase [Rhodovibrio salinarum]MBK1697595.1 cobalt-precorrin-5B (C(1))-methyltransferase [Rhodovibrio salinarum]